MHGPTVVSSRSLIVSKITPVQIRHQSLLLLPINMLLRTSILLQLVGALITTQGKSAPCALLVRFLTPQYVTRCLNQPTSCTAEMSPIHHRRELTRVLGHLELSAKTINRRSDISKRVCSRRQFAQAAANSTSQQASGNRRGRRSVL